MFNVDHYAISVKNMDESIAFYEKLDFSVIKDWTSDDRAVRIAQMSNGIFILEMFCYRDGMPLPEFVKGLNFDLQVAGSKHMGLWVEDLEKAADYLLAQGMIEKKPAINKGRLGRDYFFIKDPTGIFVEIISKR